MGRLGCDLDGNMNESKFSDPMPWIGLYVAAASVACAIAMALDVIHGFRNRKFWFPSKYFSLNATSLTILPVAIKFSVDLNTPMPRGLDQLAKLSSAALFCTIMGNSMPSIGTMENSEILTNVVALAILVITVAVNICIQLGTGIIYVFRIEHIFFTFLMLVLLLILSSSALTVPTIKRYLEIKYKMKHEKALKEGCSEQECSATKEAYSDSERTLLQKLKEDLMKHWMMAHTSSPQFVMGRSATCIASGAFCLLGALVLTEAMLRYYLMPQSFRFCSGKSDYKWSATLVLFSQTIAVGVGTIAPALRWFTAINFRCPTRGKIIYRKNIKVERYWIQMLLEMKDCPLRIRIRHRYCRKLAHDAKNKLLDLCLGIQMAVVLASKMIQFLSIFLISRVLFLLACCRELKKKFIPNNSISFESGDSQSESRGITRQDLCQFVLHLEGENALVEVMMKGNCDATDHWIQKGKKEQPKHLQEILNMSSRAQAFKGVKEFDTDLVPSLDSQQPPNCWALPVVTLASIALALPNINSLQAKQLIHGVQEGLVYINLIEEFLDAKQDQLNLRRAASIVWQGVDLHHRWLDVDLHKLSIQAESTKEVLERVSNAAKKKYEELKKTHLNQCLNKRPSYWPIKLLAANSMYRISQTVLLKHKNSNDMVPERLFEELLATISDILGACLTNLPRVVSLKCLRSTIEAREVSVRHAVLLLGQTEEILKLLQHRAPVNLDPDQMASIDEWRSLHKRTNPLSTAPSSPEKKDTSISSDFYLTIE
ncbi:hypothetical protein HS088_TW20G00223 [Tripterygium wilfordii]|uniref:Transmembrane protein n=1 Tax=Tripterygium wilfordii TaxID=458696 RepID=A0A7J7C6V2_TRIWF|nr:uncharacterized protein LOC119987184 [Tripterygium wilfordii]KAF5729858.1 hypothetical protein HS088_TW20G00223 [Tripterygium wilfordii]